MSSKLSTLLLLSAALASCRQAPDEQRFPKPLRDVAPIVGDAFSTEDARDRLGEAEQRHGARLSAASRGLLLLGHDQRDEYQ